MFLLTPSIPLLKVSGAALAAACEAERAWWQRWSQPGPWHGRGWSCWGGVSPALSPSPGAGAEARRGESGARAEGRDVGRRTWQLGLVGQAFGASRD